jgi:hypothetical protein
MIKKLKTFILMLLDKLLAYLKKERDCIEADIQRIKSIECNVEKTVEKPVETTLKTSVLSDLQEGEQFICHYCRKSFTLLSKNIFTTSVRLLYQDNYVTGKGVLCPYCLKACITG